MIKKSSYIKVKRVKLTQRDILFYFQRGGFRIIKVRIPQCSFNKEKEEIKPMVGPDKSL